MPKNESNINKGRIRSAYITSTISMSLLLFLLGLIGILLLNTKKLSDYVKENIGFTIFLKDNVREVDIYRIQKSLDAKYYVKETNYITKEEAAIELKEELGEDFVEFLGYNPLLSSIEAKFYAKYANLDSILIIKNELQKIPEVKEVYYKRSLIHLVNSNIRKISLIILGFSGLLFLIAVALINNTIRLSIYSRRFIIRTMQLVGATNNFIRKPILAKNMVYGIIGALIANSFLTVIIYFSQKEMEGIITLNDIKTLVLLYLIVILLGIILNGSSTYMAVTKYLKIKTDQLYN